MVNSDNTFKIFFSVIIPTYNCATLLKRALNSVFSQTYQNFEVIVVDNSSTDNTNNVLKSFADNRLNIVKVNNNGIIAYSRNVGIQNAKGEWIAFLDSDDVWKPKKLEIVRETIVINPEVILVCHDEWHVDNGKAKKRLKYGPDGTEIYERLLFKGNCLSTSAVCLSKEVALKSSGFSEREDFVTVEDYEYWIRLAQSGEFLFIDEVLGEWHTHDSNHSSKGDIHTNSLINVVEYHINLWSKKFPGIQREANYCRARMYFNVSRSFQKEEQYIKGAKYSIKSIIINPFHWKPWTTLFLCLFRFNNK